jgi:flagellar basal-body rod protein FlgC
MLTSNPGGQVIQAREGYKRMNLFGVMELSGTALKAERIRAEVVAANMANAETTRTEEGGPYQRQHVVFAATSPQSSPFQNVLAEKLGNEDEGAEGVEVAAVVADPGSPLRRYDPGHPDADSDGYVSFPDINPMTEMVDLMGATRSYGLNATAVQAEKGMLQSSIDLLK